MKSGFEPLAKCIYPRCLLSDGALGYVCMGGRDCGPDEMSMSLAAEHKRLKPPNSNGTAHEPDDGAENEVPNREERGVGSDYLTEGFLHTLSIHLGHEDSTLDIRYGFSA